MEWRKSKSLWQLFISNASTTEQKNSWIVCFRSFWSMLYSGQIVPMGAYSRVGVYFSESSLGVGTYLRGFNQRRGLYWGFYGNMVVANKVQVVYKNRKRVSLRKTTPNSTLTEMIKAWWAMHERHQMQNMRKLTLLLNFYL